MTTKTYPGSCPCGRVKFEASVDLSKGTNKCNCTSCWKRRWWSVAVKPDQLRALSGEGDLKQWRAGQKGPGGFCTHCGVTPYVHIDAAEWNDGAYYSVNVSCLDGLDPADLLSNPIHFMDGLHDNWWSKPAETRHL